MGSFAGPNIVKDSLYNYHIATTSGVFTPNFSGNVEVLVVAGGGGGGMDMGGGGGGGGVLSSTSYAVTAGTGITVTVGAGGSGAPPGGPPFNNTYHQFWVSATQGGNSVFGSLTAVGGGYGGSSYFGYTPNYGYGGNGGSGGGASGYSDGNTGRNGTGTSGQGNAGGASLGQYYSGGGGGAGTVGQQNPPHGGDGILNSILGPSYYWGGGGGGAAYSTGVGGNGGKGGGGGGSSNGLGDTTGINPGKNAGGGGGGDWVNTPGGNGGQFTGGGGGGGMHYNRNNYGGNGGSGIVIIRYLKSLGSSTFNSGSTETKSSLVLSLDAGNVGKGSSVEVLIVAGGGGGGSDMGGGGGAGGVIYKSSHPVQINVAVPVTIGAGGAGAVGYANTPPPGSNGNNTSFGTIVAIGGGGGGSGHYYPSQFGDGLGRSGGSGGGDSPLWGRNNGATTGSGINGQGYQGGAAGFNGDGSYTAGGGGGATRPGWGGRGTWRAGNGGDGYLSSINGTSLYWAGGGGGAHHENTGGSGGAGGGGGGSGWSGGTPGSGGAGLNAGGNGINNTSLSVGGAGGANTGGGGGGGGHQSTGGAGGSGIVIVRYYGAQKATGGTVTSVNGYTVHTFTSSGTFTPTGFLDIGDTNGSELKGTVVGATYSSSNGGCFVLNGSTNYISLSLPVSSSSPYTILQWVKPDVALTDTIATDGTGRKTPLVGPGPQWSPGYWLTARNFRVHSYTEYRDHTINLVGDTGWHLLGQVFDGTNCYGILDGVLLSGGTRTAYSPGSQTALLLGAENTTGNSYNWNGKFGPITIFNRTLSAAEVKQNFQALRGRFGI